MGLTRRNFLQGTAGVVLLGTGQVLLTAPNAAASTATTTGYGPLVADPAGRLALPEGFSYKIVTETGRTVLESGEVTPDRHDGTGAFKSRRGGTVLVNNHEISLAAEAVAEGENIVPHLPGLVYDPAFGGGCTVVETDHEGNRLAEWVGVAGTATNCAGGITPWNTWLTCEENDTRAGEDGATQDHGYVFEVDPFDRNANLDPKPIKALGRAAHEAAAVDPQTCEIYLTEDASGPNGLFYRWTPPSGFRGGKGALRTLGPTDGVVAAMRCTFADGSHVDDLARGVEIGTTYDVTWTPVPDRDAATTPLREQLPETDITRGRKLEGMWWGDGGAYVVTSYGRLDDGSPVEHDGQVWFYNPKNATLTLKVRFGVNPTPDTDGPFDGPDNITVSPWGGLILAEDGEGIQHLIGVTGGGDTFPLARNDMEGDSEFTGPVYSHDKQVLFANVQTPGTMYAITGPWKNQR